MHYHTDKTQRKTYEDKHIFPFAHTHINKDRHIYTYSNKHIYSHTKREINTDERTHTYIHTQL